jgi:hypothetical protein
MLISMMSVTPFFCQLSNSPFFIALGIGQVGMGLAHTGAEQFHAAARASRFDDGRFARARLSELLGHRGRERIDSGGTHYPDLVARRRRVGHRGQCHDGRSRRHGYELAVHLILPGLTGGR